MASSRSKFLASFVLVLGILPYFTAGQLQFGRCNNEPCQNGGTCRPIFRLFYTCTCTDDFAGGSCQYERACSANPCLNGGSCTDNPPDYENRDCVCPPNVYGENCEIVRECLDDDVRCGPFCFPAISRCDYNPDCPDETDEEGCNEIDVTPSGVNLTSPYYPRPGYIDGFDYTWYLTSPDDHYISVEFSTFDFEYNSDVILIGDGRDNSYDNAIYRLTGYYQTLRILPKSSSIWIRMVTDDNSSPNFGFEGYAKAVPIAEAETTECDPDTEFDCKDGLCLDSSIVCDDFSQCATEADEFECPLAFCFDGGYIPEYERCNAHVFCPEGEDEKFCEPFKLGAKFYLETPIESYGKYEANSNETWVFYTEPGLCFTAYFGYFYTEKYYDIWYIGYDLNAPDASGTALSGNFAIDPFVIPTGQMFVNFQSDGSKNDGYVLMEVEVVNKTELLYCEKGSFVHKNQICDGQWQCLDGRDEVDCAPITIGESRKVESTYYPEGYPNNAHQVWTFTTEEDLKLMLYISFLLTEPNYDVLAIGSGSSCTTHSFANISGAYLDHYVLSEDNTMCIYYSSDYSVQNIGFTATVYTVTEEDYFTCSFDGSFYVPSQKCDFRWHCPDGEDEQGCDLLPLYAAIPISSPNYPYPYPPDSIISFSGTSEPGSETYFDFEFFDFEENQDFLIIGCGLDPFNYSTVVANFTGSKPVSVSVPCESIWLQLVSDGDGYNLGYRGTGYIVPTSDLLICSEDGSTVPQDYVCDGRWHCPLTGDDESSCPRIPLNGTVYFASDNYPSPYPADAYFIHSGSGEEGKSAYVEFYDFDLEDGKDFLIFGCGSDPFDLSTIRRNLTGPGPVDPFTLECDSIWFTFKSDSNEVLNRGYYGVITVVDRTEGFTCSEGTVVHTTSICDGRWDCILTGEDERGCPRVPLGASTPFESDGYPTPYANDEFIIFYGEAEEGLSVVFEFIDFDLEEDRDFLTFGCGDNPYDQSTVVESLTGGLPPTLTIDCDRIWFTFRSDSSQGDNRGFLGIVTTVEREVPSGDLVAGRCQSYLPYSEAAPEALFPFRLAFDRDVIRDLIMGPACDDDEILRGICTVLYPPRGATSPGLCSSTCEKFRRCDSVDLLMEVDCEVIESDTALDDYPGLCLYAEAD